MQAVLIIVCCTLGALLGYQVGMLLGLGALVIPGFGPFAGAGSMGTSVGTATLGALVGGVLGGVGGLGVTRVKRSRASTLKP